MADTVRFPFTQRDAFAVLRSLVENTEDLGIEDEELAEVLTPDAMLEFLDHRIAQLDKPKATEKKPTARQVENEGYKANILAWMEPDTAYQSAEIAKGVPELVEAGMKPQRVVHILTSMVKDGSITRVEDKRKTYYSLA